MFGELFDVKRFQKVFNKKSKWLQKEMMCHILDPVEFFNKKNGDENHAICPRRHEYENELRYCAIVRGELTIL